MFPKDNTFNKLAAGDPQAFRSFFEAFYDPGYHHLAGYLTDDDTIRDILQETFIGIWQNRSSLKSSTHLRIYFYKSLRNNAVRRLTRDRHTDILDAFADESETVLDSISRTEFIRQISELVGKLPEERRKVVILAMNGLTVKDIADELQLSVNTVKTHKRLAYGFLRTEIDRLLTIFFLFF